MPNSATARARGADKLNDSLNQDVYVYPCDNTICYRYVQGTWTSLSKLGSFLSELLSSGGSWLGQFSQLALGAAYKLAELAFSKLLANATDFNVNGLWDNIDQIKTLAEDTTAIMKAIVLQPQTFIDNMLAGLQQGFTNFFDPTNLLSVLESVQDQAIAWLFGSFQNVNLPTALDATQIFQFALDLLGLSVNSIVSLAQQAIQAAYGITIPVDKVLSYLDAIEDIAGLFFDDDGDFDLSGVADRLQEDYTDLFDPQTLFNTVFTAFTDQLKNTLLKQLLGSVTKWVAQLVVPGAAVINVIYQGVKWVAGYASKILCILKQAFGLLSAAVGAGGKSAVASGLVKILKGGIGLLLSTLPAILQALGLPDIGALINDVINNIKQKVQDWIKQALQTLLGKNKNNQPSQCNLPMDGTATPATGGMRPMLNLGCSGQCFSADTRVRTPAGLVLLPELLPGRSVLTYPDDGVRESVDVRVARERLRLVRLELDYGGGDGVEALLLRGAEWLASASAVAGGVLWLDMPEMGAVGWARVKAIEPCPPLEDGLGALVTGWFRHWRAGVGELRVQGEAAALGVTLRHPFWSMDRGDWVAVGELSVGERLLAWDGGTPSMQSFTLREQAEPVYNIEVDGDHCYRVGEQGLLVHNSSAGNPNPATPNPASLTIAQKVAAAGVQVSDTTLVNFGSMARQTVDPTQSPISVAKSYWFMYGDIKSLTLIQLQAAAIGPMAMASLPGGANYMRTTALPSTQFNRVTGNNFAGVDEYEICTPVPVQQSVYVGN